MNETKANEILLRSPPQKTPYQQLHHASPSAQLSYYNHSPPPYNLQQSQRQSSSLLSPKKSPVKYHYLTNQQQEQKQKKWRITWLEFFSTFIFIYAVTCYKNSTGIDLQFFVGLIVAIPICAKQTGANLNPSVSYSMTYKMEEGKNKGFWIGLEYYGLLWIYIKAQVIGASVAMFLGFFINNVYFQPASPTLINNSGSSIFQKTTLYSLYQIILSQSIGTFILIFVIFLITSPYSFISRHPQKHNSTKYFYIALFVYIGRKFACLSHNQINLALTFSQALIGLYYCNFNGFYFIFVWIIGDILGVTLAGMLYFRVVEPMREGMEKKRNQRIGEYLKSRRRYDGMILMKQIPKQQDEKNLKQNQDRYKKQNKQKQKEGYYKKLEYF